MKNIYLLLTFTILLSGCNDFLTRDNPFGATDEDFWKTSGEVEAALNLCYCLPSGSLHYTAPYASIIHYEGFTDNTYHGADFGIFITTIGNSTITSDSPNSFGGITDVWNTYYKNIRNCCRMLENMDKAYFVDQNERERMRAEAIILRAYYHWELFKYFGYKEGIPVVDHALSPNENFMERSAPDVVVDFILAELDRAIAIDALPFKYEESKKHKVDRSVAYALKSIVGLNTKRYDVSMKASEEIINSGNYELFYTTSTDDDPARSFRDLFRSVGKVNKERILFKPGGCNEAYFRFSGPGLGQQCTSHPTLDFVNAFETKQGKTPEELGPDSLEIYSRDPLYNDNRDPRLYATIVMPYDNTTFEQYTYDPWGEGPEAIGRPNASRSGFMLKKFYDPQDRTSPSNDFMIIRYAEILLNKVECLIETGRYNDPNVLGYINMIRKRAGQIEVSTTEYNTEAKVRELYRRERRIELAFEGVRYMDIRRWDIGEQTMNGPIYGAVNPATGRKIQIETRQFKKNKNEVWPIPESEVLANPNLEQNQGYVGKD